MNKKSLLQTFALVTCIFLIVSCDNLWKVEQPAASISFAIDISKILGSEGNSSEDSLPRDATVREISSIVPNEYLVVTLHDANSGEVLQKKNVDFSENLELVQVEFNKVPLNSTTYATLVIKHSKENSDPIYFSAQSPSLKIERKNNVLETRVNAVFLDSKLGNDSNSGFTPVNAVKTMEKAVEVLGGTRELIDNATVCVMDSITIAEDTTWDYPALKIKKYQSFNGETLVNINDSIEFKLGSIIFDSNSLYVTDSARLLHIGDTATLNLIGGTTIINSGTEGNVSFNVRENDMEAPIVVTGNLSSESTLGLFATIVPGLEIDDDQKSVYVESKENGSFVKENFTIDNSGVGKDLVVEDGKLIANLDIDIQTIRNTDIDDELTVSVDEMATRGLWTITDGLFTSDDAVFVTAAGSSIRYEDISSAIADAIEVANTQVSVASFTTRGGNSLQGTAAPQDGAKLTIQLVAEWGYVFEDGSGIKTIELTFDIRQLHIVFDATIDADFTLNDTNIGINSSEDWMLENGSITGDNPAVFLRPNGSATYDDIKNALFGRIDIRNTTKEITSFTITGVTDTSVPADDKEDVALTIRLTTVENYEFEDGSTEKDIELKFVIKGMTALTDSDIEGSVAVETSEIRTTAPLTITAGEPDTGSNAVVEVFPNADVTYNDIANAIANAIDIPNTSATVKSITGINYDISPDKVNIGNERPDVESPPYSDITLTFTLTAKAGYIFEGNSATKDMAIVFSVTKLQKIVFASVTGKEIDATTGKAGLSPITINSDFSVDTTDVMFDYNSITEAQNIADIKASIVEAFEGDDEFAPGVYRYFTNLEEIVVTIAAGRTIAVVTLPLIAEYGYVFDGNEREKNVKINLTGGFIPSAQTYYVSNSNASDTNAGTQDSPFASVQRAVDVVKAFNDEATEYTIEVSGTIIDEGTEGIIGSADDGLVEIETNNTLNLTIKGTGAIDGNAAKRVLYVEGSTINLTLAETLKIQNGFVGDAQGHVLGDGNRGAGMYIKAGNVTIQESVLIQNNSMQLASVNPDPDPIPPGYVSEVPYGGGVYVAENAHLTMTGGNIQNNSIEYTQTESDWHYHGGGVYVAGAFTMSSGSITGNTVHSTSNSNYANAAGVYVSPVGKMYLSGSPRITDNLQKRGLEQRRSNLFTEAQRTVAIEELGNNADVEFNSFGGYGSIFIMFKEGVAAYGHGFTEVIYPSSGTEIKNPYPVDQDKDGSMDLLQTAEANVNFDGNLVNISVIVDTRFPE